METGTTEPSAPIAESAGPGAAPVETPAVPAEVEAPASVSVDASAAEREGAAVVMDAVTKLFDGEPAVADLSLVVQPGTILGIIGPSGAGKTTTIRMLTGALEPTSGTVSVLGEDPRRFRRRTRERIGYMPQLFALYPDLTARENVDFVASLFGVLWRTRHRRTREVLEFVDLWDVRGRRAGALSGGMQRRLELACALVHSPDLIFLDEPTAGIDPLLRARIWEELHRQRDAGRTLLVTTQYVGEAESCDTVALISGGRLIALAPPDALRRLAIGGDMIEVETAGPLDPAVLNDLAGAHSIERIDARRARITVDDAATALPDLVDSIRAGGGEITSAQEVRPSFDAVFTTLVERDRAAHPDGAASADAGEAA
jgi:ABC-2 type transport system ATP-binding protein